MDKRKVAIIGGSGFIGTRPAKRLSERDDLTLVIVDQQPSAHFPALYQYGDVTRPRPCKNRWRL